MNFRAFKSLTFFVGLILFVGAFAALVLAGNLFNPAPYRIVIAKKDMPAYSRLTPDMLAVDEQTMNSKVAERLIHENEIDRFLGGTVIEPIHAGEPLRLLAIVTADSPGAADRLSLALDDPDKVAMVVPVTPDIIPDDILAGDYVNIQLGVGQIQQQYGDYGRSTTNAASPETVPLPFAKIVLQNIPVLQVYHEQIPNPNYGNRFGDQSQSEAPYIDGDLQRITVLIPKDAQEMLAFAIDNGTLRLSLVPLVAVKNNLPQPTDGVTWEDFQAFFKAQREARQAMVSATPSTPLLSGRTPATATIPLSVTATLSQTSAAIPGGLDSAVAGLNEAVSTAIAKNPDNPGVIRANDAVNAAEDVTAIKISSLILPGILCLAAMLILAGGAILLKRARRKQETM